MTTTPRHAQPGQPADLPLHQIIGQGEELFAYVAGRTEERIFILLADRDGNPTGEAGTIKLEDIVADVPADPQPERVPARARLLFEKLVEDVEEMVDVERTPVEVMGAPAA